MRRDHQHRFTSCLRSAFDLAGSSACALLSGADDEGHRFWNGAPCRLDYSQILAFIQIHSLAG